MFEENKEKPRVTSLTFYNKDLIVVKGKCLLLSVSVTSGANARYIDIYNGTNNLGTQKERIGSVANDSNTRTFSGKVYMDRGIYVDVSGADCTGAIEYQMLEESFQP